MNFLTKLIFSLKKPVLIIVTGRGRELTAEAIFRVLGTRFSIKKVQAPSFKNILTNRILVLTQLPQKFPDFFIKRAEKIILVGTHIGEIPPDVCWFAGRKEDAVDITMLAKKIPARSFLILNFDDETVKKIGEESDIPFLTFGFQKNADLWASDLNIDKLSTNFKINYEGNIVPVWLENLFGKANAYAALAAAACGIKLGLNLVQISQALKNFKGIK